MDHTEYDRDFFTWTQEQAAALRQAAERRINLDLDFANLAEEIESMGSEQAGAVQSALTRILEHLLKLEYSPAAPPRAGWQESVDHQRAEVEIRLKRNPGLKGRLGDLYADAWTYGRRFAARSLQRHGEVDPAVLPRDCPYSLEQVTDPDWWPANRHGLA